MTAINSCVEMDLTGQAVSDSIGECRCRRRLHRHTARALTPRMPVHCPPPFCAGHRIYSGVGGQLDFLRGAGRCDQGVPILAMPSTTSKGKSRIVGCLTPGGGVVTTRAHVHYLVTEHGIAHLFGKTLRERAKALIAVAHPDHREQLEREAFECGVLRPNAK